MINKSNKNKLLILKTLKLNNYSLEMIIVFIKQ